MCIPAYNTYYSRPTKRYSHQRMNTIEELRDFGSARNALCIDSNQMTPMYIVVSRHGVCSLFKLLQL